MYIASLYPKRPYRAISLHGHYTRPRTDGSGAAFSTLLGLSLTEDDGAWRRPIRKKGMGMPGFSHIRMDVSPIHTYAGSAKTVVIDTYF